MLLLGNWKNIEELEDSLNLDELRLIIEASRERELRQQKFMAAINGIDLDKAEVEKAQERFREVQERAQAKLRGDNRSEEQIGLGSLGFEIEVEE